MNGSLVNSSLDARFAPKRSFYAISVSASTGYLGSLQLPKSYRVSNGILGKAISGRTVTARFKPRLQPSAPTPRPQAVELATTRCIGGDKPNPVGTDIGMASPTNCQASSGRLLGSLLRIAN
jgi:hypothetical protein